MESNLPNTSPYPSANTMSASTLHPMPAPGIKRKRDSVDGGQSNERSTSRMNPPQYSMSNSSGDAFNENFFNLDQLAAASSAPREQLQSARAVAEAQLAEVGRVSANSANNAFATPSVPMAQMDGYASPPMQSREAPGPVDVVDGSTATNPDDENEEMNDAQADDPSQSPGKGNKPIVGTDEWHKARKMSHKEVERRRRSTINDAITALAGLLPKAQPNSSSSSFNPSNSIRTRTPASAAPILATSEKNKGAILAAAVTYIRTLREEKDSSINKWTFEKMVTDEAIRTLEGRLERMAKVAEGWKRVAKEAGVDVDDVEVAVRVYQGIGPAGEIAREKSVGGGVGHSAGRVGERVAGMVREEVQDETV